MLHRDQLLATLRAAAERHPDVKAMWLGGSFAFQAEDEDSDLDAVLVVPDERVEDVFSAIESALTDWSSIEVRYRIPEPTWHGFSQCFYRFADMREEHFLDLCLVPLSKVDTFNEVELHGRPVVLFDPDEVATTAELERGENERSIATRRDEIHVRHELFGHFVGKELRRGDPIAAAHWFTSMLVVPLVELLRMKHCPERFRFGSRYLRRDLPADVYEALAAVIVGDGASLGERAERARQWIRELEAEAAQGQAGA